MEQTQKDVLFGVLFYIALFVPFAFCAERLLFGYRNIHKRIIAFTALLLLLIAVIYNVHPAFDLAYSPTVVILAFFIIGLSLIVTLIIFLRFEEEMSLLQHRAQRKSVEGISRWKAFVASFFLGVSNLKRRQGVRHHEPIVFTRHSQTTTRVLKRSDPFDRQVQKGFLIEFDGELLWKGLSAQRP